MRKVVLVFFLWVVFVCVRLPGFHCKSFGPGLAHADTDGESGFDAAVNADSAETAIGGDPWDGSATNEIWTQFNEEITYWQTNFADFGTISALIPGSGGAGATAPVIDFGSSNYIGDLVFDFGLIPGSVWTVLNSVVLIMCSWQTFLIVARP